MIPKSLIGAMCQGVPGRELPWNSPLDILMHGGQEEKADRIGKQWARRTHRISITHNDSVFENSELSFKKEDT